MKIKLFLLLTTLLFAGNVFAWGWEDFKEEAASPYTTDARYALYGGTLVTVTLAIFEDSVVDPFQKNKSVIKLLEVHRTGVIY